MYTLFGNDFGSIDNFVFGVGIVRERVGRFVCLDMFIVDYEKEL